MSLQLTQVETIDAQENRLTMRFTCLGVPDTNPEQN